MRARKDKKLKSRSRCKDVAGQKESIRIQSGNESNKVEKTEVLWHASRFLFQTFQPILQCLQERARIPLKIALQTMSNSGTMFCGAVVRNDFARLFIQLLAFPCSRAPGECKRACGWVCCGFCKGRRRERRQSCERYLDLRKDQKRRQNCNSYSKYEHVKEMRRLFCLLQHCESPSFELFWKIILNRDCG